MKKILVFGGMGRFGQEICKRFTFPFAVPVAISRHTQLNKVDWEELQGVIFSQRVRTIEQNDIWDEEINCSLSDTKLIIESRIPKEIPIIVMSSIAAERIVTEQPISYHVVKAGLNQMVRYYAFQGYRINAIAPSHLSDEEIKESTLDLIEFLLSDKAKALTGQCITIDKGKSAAWTE